MQHDIGLTGTPHPGYERVTEALGDPERATFTRAEVAWMLGMMFRSGADWGFELGYSAAEGKMFDGVVTMLGGAEAVDMPDAVQRHLSWVRARDLFRNPRPRRNDDHVRDTPDWPKVTQPGTAGKPQ